MTHQASHQGTSASSTNSTTTPTAPGIWAHQPYPPPRGPCNHKAGTGTGTLSLSLSLLSARCACQRFMLHPLHAAGSFDCDGCGHHASFHDLENRREDEVVARWRKEAEEEAEERERERDRERKQGGGGRKRRRLLEGGGGAAGTRRRGATAKGARVPVVEVEEEEVD